MSARTVGALLSSMAVVAWVSPAWTGVADSTLPVLTSGGAAARHVFSVPGTIKNNLVETEFVCTSLEPLSSARVAVEVFLAGGGDPLNDVSDPILNGAATLEPGETVTIATGATQTFHEDKIINFKKCKGGSNPPPLCTSDLECNGGTCTGLKCTGPTTPGAPCTNDGDCGAGTCSQPLRNGSARIVSESTKLSCTAFLVFEDPAAVPPQPFTTALKVIKKKIQKGD